MAGVLGFVGVSTGLMDSAVAADGRYFPTWDRRIVSERFLSRFGGAAYLDRETGILWERSPSNGLRGWFNASQWCQGREIGGRWGWRLPTVEELASLLDSTESNPALPSGHPFSGIQSSGYWSATTQALFPANAKVVNFGTAGVDQEQKDAGFTHYAWCVRAGHAHDGGFR